MAAGATNIYSTSKEGVNNLVVTIGPEKGEFVIEGAEEDFFFWRHPDDVTDVGECLEIDNDDFCLMQLEEP